MNPKRSISLLAAFAVALILILGTGPTTFAATGDLVITGVVDGPLTGGIPKAVELHALNDIANLSDYGLESANNGGGAAGAEFTFPADSVSAGTFIYVASENTAFESFFGFLPTYTSSAASINGDDAIVLYQSSAIVDIFGDADVDGTGEPWDYLDGWAYRVADTGQDGSTFVVGNWTFSGTNALDGETTNAAATVPFPIGTYTGTSGGGGGSAFIEPFNDMSQFTANTAFFSDGFGDYFGLTSGDFGGGAVPSALKPYTGFDGSFLTGMDLDGEGATLPIVIDWAGIDVSGLTTIEFSGDFAEYFDSPGDIDDADYLRVTYQIDGGGYQNLLWFSGADFSSTSGPSNGVFREDTDFDGTGDGIALGDASQTFVKNIVGNGTTLDLRLTISLNSGDEDFAVDNFIIREAVATPTGQPLPLFEGFDSCALSGWEIISVDSDTANTWVCNDFFSNIEANGFGDSAPANEWLITPPLDMDAQENDTLRFRSYTRFTDVGLPYPQVTVQYSTDYAGSGDPTAATWTELTGITFSPENSQQWVDSGVVDLSGISGDTVYFAFQYESSGTGGGSTSLWRLDSINFASFIPVGQCGDPATIMIHDIQGVGDAGADPLLGETVVIEGVVVGDFQPDDGDHTDLGGFFVQEEDADADSDPQTSEGIFVFAPWAADVNVGDGVRIKGGVSDYFGMTQISASDVVVCDPTSLPAATAVTLPADLEAVEGMLVTMDQTLYISEFFNFDRYGEIVLSTERQYQPTATYEPGSPEAAALAAANTTNRITLDDGRTNQNPDPAIHPNGDEFTLDNLFRGGDMVDNVTGVINYGFGNYRIQPTQGADYTPVNPRTAAPDEVGGTIQVASFNVLNYFTTLNSRGANTVEEFERQRAKIIAAITAMDADVVGLIEIENNDAAIVDLVAGLNEANGAGTYAYIDTGVIGTDAIKVAIIYKPASVTPVGNYAVLDSSVDARFIDTKNRPALAQTFYDRFTGGDFTVVVNHLKSKGSDCNDLGDPDTGDGSGNCNITRTLAAQAMVDWLATDPTGSGDPDFLIIGDLNSYDKEDPIDAILAGADDVLGSGDDYTDLLYTFIGEDAYSYVFNGQLGYLDHGLANASLLPQVTGTTVWHINADEADLIDYDTSFKQDAQDAIYAPDAYRSSDHDPVVIGLQLQPEGPIVNGDGCLVIGLPTTPYIYAVNAATLDAKSLKLVEDGTRYQFKAEKWLREQGFARNACVEIHGTDWEDQIFGARGDDIIYGYGDDDLLEGKQGDDTLIGGAGEDDFKGNGGYDTVLDFEDGEECSDVEVGCWED